MLQVGDITSFFFDKNLGMDGEFVSLDRVEPYTDPAECEVLEINGNTVHLACADRTQNDYYHIIDSVQETRARLLLRKLIEAVVKEDSFTLSAYPPPNYADDVSAVGGHREKDKHMAGLRADVDSAKAKHGKPEKNKQDDKSDLLNDMCEEDMPMDEVAPPGWEGSVKGMKKHKEIDNPFALAWSMRNKGYKSHKKEK